MIEKKNIALKSPQDQAKVYIEELNKHKKRVKDIETFAQQEDDEIAWLKEEVNQLNEKLADTEAAREQW